MCYWTPSEMCVAILDVVGHATKEELTTVELNSQVHVQRDL